MSRGRGRFNVDRVPYSGDVARAKLAGIRNVILVGAPPPVTFFAYPGKSPRPYPEDADVLVLARPEQDLAEALARLADELGAPAVALPASAASHEIAKGAVTSAPTVDGKSRTIIRVADVIAAPPATEDQIAALKAPRPRSKSAATSNVAVRTVVTVRPGDTLSTLAAQHGVSISALKRANGMTGSRLRAGQKLKIPQG